MLTILLYHGVSSEINKGIENCSGKHIETSIFERQMSYLSSMCNVITMDEVVEINNQGLSYPDNAVAITFDDGFRNNVTEAQPILEKYQVPATFYVSPGIINTNIMFWVDSIEDCINNAKVSQITLNLDSRKKYNLENDKQKIKALIEIKSYCKGSTSAEKDRVILDLIDETLWMPKVSSSKNYEKMSWNELQTLASNKLFTIGGHSLYHDILSSFEKEKKLRLDIQLSIQLLEYNLNAPVIHYAYPEGQESHYNQAVIDILSDMGVVCSPSAIDGVNNGEYDLFNLRRIMVGINGKKFPFEL